MPTPAVFVFIQAGCGACMDYEPKFARVAAEHPPGAPVVGIYDLADNNARVQEFSEKLGIRATPTTVVMTSSGAFHRHVGSLPVAQIRDIFAKAK